MKNLILLGAPGAGKGSQAVKISAAYGIPHISTGDILRRNIKEETELGKMAKGYIDKGQLVPDEVVIDIVRDRLAQADAKQGYILDGFPRTLAQAEALDRAANIDLVINIVVPFEIIEKRLTGRRMCLCGETYHTSTYGSDLCSKCGGKLFIRDDDKAETVKERLKVYESQTAPLITYYTAKGLVKDVEGGTTVEDTFRDVKAILEK